MVYLKEKIYVVGLASMKVVSSLATVGGYTGIGHLGPREAPFSLLAVPTASARPARYAKYACVGF